MQVCACNGCVSGVEYCECAACEYGAELNEYHRPIERLALNGERVKLGENERYTDGQGRYGYVTQFSGVYVCYTCGHVCECGENE